MKGIKARFISDTPLFVATVTLLLLSLLMIYSTTGVIAGEKFGDHLYYVKRQLMSVFIGTLALFAAASSNLHSFRNITKYFFFASVLLLLLVFVPGIGKRGGGALRWVRLAFIQFQPAELVKLFVVFFMSGYLTSHESKLCIISYSVFRPFIYLGVLAALLLLQPDFGATAIIFIVAFGMILAAGAKLSHLMLSLVAVSGCGALLIYFSPYRMQRVLSFLDPYKDPSGSGYQLIQSLIAVGEGGMWGMGLAEGRQKLFFLPAAHTDFIFSVFAEEMGFVGAILLILLYSVIFWRGMALAFRLRDDTYLFSLATGLTLLISLPAFMNIAVAIGLLPTKGLPLPLVSYGGSSIVVSMMCIGFLLGIGRRYG